VRPLRLLALVQKRLDLAPGQRYRLEQWAPRLERLHDIRLDFAVFESNELSETLYKPGHRARKAQLIVSDFWRRREILSRARDYDAVVVYREAALLGPAIYERLLAAMRIPIVVDFDDAIWLAQPSGPNGVFARLRFPGKTASICRLADAVTVGNEYLARYARELCGDVSIVPTTVDLSTYHVAPPIPDEGPFVIVWTGSHSTLAHLEHARGAIERLGRSRAVRLRVICDRPPARPFANVDNEFVKWQSSTEAADVAAAHVGIMPVPDEPFTRGKCALKGLLYMASGRPAVLSPVGVNADIVRPWENGVLATSEDEWHDALERLAASPELRRTLGAAGRRTVEEGYSAEQGAKLFAEVCRRAVSGRARRSRGEGGDARAVP